MKKLFIFFPIIFVTCFIIACTGSSSENNNTDKQSASSDPSTASSNENGNDMFYEYKMTTSAKEMNIQSDTKMYMSSGGDMRVEMNVSNSRVAGSAPIVLIGNSNKPNESISIDDSAKTYSVNHFNDSDLINTGEKMNVKSVTKIGEEKILDYNSIHARIVVEKSIGGFYSNVDTIDIWKSNDVPFPSVLKTLFDKFEAKTGNTMYPPAVAAQLKQLGCDGFLTKMTVNSKTSSMTDELIKVEHRDLPASMFKIPSGYTESKDGM